MSKKAVEDHQKTLDRVKNRRDRSNAKAQAKLDQIKARNIQRQKKLDEMDDDSMSVSSGSSGSSSVSVPSVKSMSSQSSMTSVSGESISSQDSSASSESIPPAKKSPAPSKELKEAIGRCETAKVKTQKAIDDSVKQTAMQEHAIYRFKNVCTSKCKKHNEEFQKSLAHN